MAKIVIRLNWQMSQMRDWLNLLNTQLIKQVSGQMANGYLTNLTHLTDLACRQPSFRRHFFRRARRSGLLPFALAVKQDALEQILGAV